MNTTPPSFDELLQKIETLRAQGNFDLSRDEDLSIAIMNLVSLEEHFFFTASKTKKDEYFDLLHETREIRKQLLGKMIDHHEGETWCIAKHLLAASMRCVEVGTKLFADHNKKEAQEMFRHAYKVYSLFWALRLKLMSVDDVKKIPDRALNIHDKSQKGPWTTEDIVSKLVDCCDE